MRNAENGHFEAGNSFWKARSSHGRKPIFSNCEDLLSACEEYFAWVEVNPLYEVKAFSFQGCVTQESIPKMRAMTIAGLCIFLNINRDTWDSWKKNRADLTEVIEHVEGVIFEQKFTGAAADLLNANIISRDLGLADKAAVDNTSSDGSMSPTGLSTGDIADAIRRKHAKEKAQSGNSTTSTANLPDEC